MNKEDCVRICYEWQKEDMKVGSWAKKFGEEIERIGLGFIWNYPGARNEKDICKIIKIRCRDIQRQMTFTNIWVKRSPADYCDMKVGGCMKHYVVQCNRNDSTGLDRFRMVVRKLRGLISGVGKGVWPLC
jgi:hypothetical protein